MRYVANVEVEGSSPFLCSSLYLSLEEYYIMRMLLTWDEVMRAAVLYAAAELGIDPESLCGVYVRDADDDLPIEMYFPTSEEPAEPEQ